MLGSLECNMSLNDMCQELEVVRQRYNEKLKNLQHQGFTHLPNPLIYGKNLDHDDLAYMQKRIMQLEFFITKAKHG